MKTTITTLFIIFLFLSTTIASGTHTIIKQNDSLEKTTTKLASDTKELLSPNQKNNDAPNYGPTPLNSAVGNGNLTIGIDKNGTIALFTWPNPSYYDHIDYRTISKYLPQHGVKPNMGIFAGITYYQNKKQHTSWFKSNEWTHTQYYLHENTNVVVTEFTHQTLHINVSTTVLVLPNKDVLTQNFNISIPPTSNIHNVSLILFENLNPCTYKLPAAPISDWLFEQLNDFKVTYNKEIQGISHYKPTFFPSLFSPQKTNGIYITIAASSSPSSYQCGIEGKNHGLNQDAYQDALDGTLSNNSYAYGKVDSALSFPIASCGNTPSITVYFSTHETREQSIAQLQEAKSQSYEHHLEHTNTWWQNWLSTANLPKWAPADILGLAKRSLMVIRMCYHPETGTIVASPSRQAPYGEDWPRDGAYIDYALDVAGYHTMVDKHKQFYVDVQRPSGRWEMCYYADGMIGGPIPFEIDSIGLTIWSYFEHYRFTNNYSYLANVFPAIKKAANLLTVWQDPFTNLHLPANEDDHIIPSQTIRGAAPVVLGLKYAIKAGDVIGAEKKIIQRWRQRKQELEAAIETHLWDGQTYGDIRCGGATMIWPLMSQTMNQIKLQQHLSFVYHSLLERMNSTEGIFSYPSKPISALAHIWRNDTRVQHLVEWLASISTDDTHVFGEWCEPYRQNGKIQYKNMVSVPHAWTHALFYIAAMFAYT